jgi:hypothetical protein
MSVRGIFAMGVILSGLPLVASIGVQMIVHLLLESLCQRINDCVALSHGDDDCG